MTLVTDTGPVSTLQQSARKVQFVQMQHENEV